MEGSNISGHLVVKRKFYSDNRGSLLKVFEAIDSKNLCFQPEINQINLVETRQIGTIRGMHMQPAPYGEMKLITCIKGVVLDVVIDLRKDSETFLQWSSYKLDANDNFSVVVPEGCAHGLQTLSENVIVLYAHTNNFAEEYETGLNPVDPDFGIPWPIQSRIISERDFSLPTMKQWLEKSNEM